MPELPEVETVRSTLALAIKGETISHVDLIYKKIVQGDQDSFQQLIQNQTIHEIKRMGKYLIFVLDSHVMIIHLRMEGKFFIKTNESLQKHEHIVFHFKSGKQMRYHDVRKFGTLDFIKKDEYLVKPPLIFLGKEPKDLELETLYKKLQSKKVVIKVALLDQHIIAGLGNIYVDETLFLAKIHPTRISNTLSIEEVSLILTSAINVLDKAI